MRQLLAAGLLVAVLLLITTGIGAGAPAVPERVDDVQAEFVEDEILVKFEAGIDPRSVARAVGAVVVRKIQALDVVVLRVPRGAVSATVLALTNNPLVEYAEPNFIARTQVNPNDPYDNSVCYSTPTGSCVTQWAWAKVRAYDAWDFTTGSGSVRIAVVDTGILNAHEDLPPVAAQWNFVNDSSNADDDNGHGTHVAGTIGARTDNGIGVAGANWNVSLLAAKVLNANGSGTYADVAAGIIWAADQGARVINLSLGGSSASFTLQNAVNYAWSKGAVLACAAGNTGKQKKVYPGAYDRCIAVAATDATDIKASWSTWGSWVDVAAPGVSILSTVPLTDGVYRYDAWSGTSMATPHVAGLAGLIWARGVCGTNQCVRDRIEKRADSIYWTGMYWKWGRINYLKSVSP